MTGQQIIQYFANYIFQNGNVYNQWYIGITSNIAQRSENHGIISGDIGRYVQVDSNETARSLEKYFLSQGCVGDTGGGDSTSNIVYIYKINNHTKQ